MIRGRPRTSFRGFLYRTMLVFQAATLGLVLGVLISYFNRTTAQEFQNRLAADHRGVVMATEQHLGLVETRLRSLSLDSSIRGSLAVGMPGRMLEYLREMQVENDQDGTRFFVVPAGEKTTILPEPPPHLLTLLERLPGARLDTPSRTDLPAGDGMPAATVFCRPIRQEDQTLGTAVAIHLPAEDRQLHARLYSMLRTPVLLRTGDTLTDADTGQVRPLPSLLDDPLPSLERLIVGQLHGEECVLPLETSPGAYYVRSTKAFHERKTMFAISVVVLCLTAGALTLLVAVFIVQRVTEPMKGLVRQAASLTVQDPGFLFSVDEDRLAHDEFRTLAHAINEVLDKQRRADSARLRMQKRMQEAEKMEAIGQLAGGVAHDFNNILQVVMGYTDIALYQLPAEAPLRWEIEEIESAAQKGQNLVLQLLTFGRRDASNPQDVDLGRVLRNMEKMLAGLVGDHVKLILRVHPEPRFVHIDPSQFERAILNLCVNARDAMPRGGTLRVRLEDVEPSDDWWQAHPNMPADRPLLEVSVSDTGTGIPERILDRIFEPFFTTKEPGRGTGLGLAMVYGTVERYGGSVDVESTEGEGAEFRMRFPVIAEEDSHVEAPGPGLREEVHERVPETVAGNGETILVADDDADVRGLIARSLRGQGYRVITAQDGLHATQLFREHEQEVSLLILDVMMPNLRGTDAFEQIHRRCPDLPVLFCTAYRSQFLRETFLLEVGHRLLQKPFRVDELLRSVRGLLDDLAAKRDAVVSDSRGA